MSRNPAGGTASGGELQRDGLALEPDGFRLGSSLDELVVAGALISGAAQALNRDPEPLFYAVIGAVLSVLEDGRAAALAIQRALLREGRIRGPKLAALLAPVRRCELADLVLSGMGQSA